MSTILKGPELQTSGNGNGHYPNPFGLGGDEDDNRRFLDIIRAQEDFDRVADIVDNEAMILDNGEPFPSVVMAAEGILRARNAA